MGLVWEEEAVMRFLGIFFMCLIGIYLFVFFSGLNIWLLMVVIAFVLAGLLSAHVSLEERVEELEHRVSKIEGEEATKCE